MVGSKIAALIDHVQIFRIMLAKVSYLQIFHELFFLLTTTNYLKQGRVR